MSRVIIKNIPKGQTNESIKVHFSAKGKVTDVQLKYHENGNFRHFGFIGFETVNDAENAVNYFNNTFINTNKITVAICNDLFSNKPKKDKTENDEMPKLSINAKKSDEIQALLDKHKDDPLFQEYMSSHKKSGQIWSSDVPFPEAAEPAVKVSEEPTPIVVEEPAKKKKPMIELFTIKVMNTPANTKRSDVTKFFKPLKVHSIRIPKRGFCFVGFKAEEDYKKALLKNRSFMKKNQVQVVDYCERNKMDLEKSAVKETKKNSKWQKQEDELAQEDGIDETGRIYFRNLPYETTEDDLKAYFEECGPVADINLPVDGDTKRIKGFGTVTFVMPEHALLAYNKLNGVNYHGRLLHLMPAKNKDKPEINLDGLSHKEKKLVLQKQGASNPFNWNTFFMGTNAIADAIAINYETSKKDILDTTMGGSSAAVRLALGETEIVNKMKKYLEENGVRLDAFSTVVTKYSKNSFIVKNLPADTTYDEIKKLFTPFGLVSKILLPSNGVTAIVDFVDSSEAKTAYKKLAYKKFKHLPLYLEWAPADIFASDIERKPINEDAVDEKIEDSTKNDIKDEDAQEIDQEGEDEEGDDDDEPQEATTLFLRNLNFKTEESTVHKTFAKYGRIHSIQIAKKKDLENPGQIISLGYGFIQFKKHKDAEKVLRQIPYVNINGNKVELNRSDRILNTHGGSTSTRKKVGNTEQTGNKLLVRNVPFQAKESEIRDLFKVFGKLKAVRLPQKLKTASEESHRGFAFVDFNTKQDAKKAFEALSQSTHLYGRRLVLEWANPEDNVEQLRKRAADHFVGSVSKKSRKGVFEAKKIVFDENE